MKTIITTLTTLFFFLNTNAQEDIFSENVTDCVQEYSIADYNIDWSYYKVNISYKRCMDAKKWTAKIKDYRMKMFEGDNYVLLIDDYNRKLILKINKKLFTNKSWKKIN